MFGLRRQLQRSFSTAARSMRKKRGNREILLNRNALNAKHDEKAKELGLDFRVVSACILHRYPVVTLEAEDWEQHFWDVQEKVELKRSEMVNKELEGTEANMVQETGASIDDILASLSFVPASRTTEADFNDDRRSSDRKFNESLYLVVKRNREDSSWQFPQGKLRDDETLRTASERVVDRAVGQVDRWFVGNAPVGHYVYAYPLDMQQKRKEYGAKVFFYRAQLISGNVRLETRLYTDYAWITRSQVSEYFDKETADYFQELLLN